MADFLNSAEYLNSINSQPNLQSLNPYEDELRNDNMSYSLNKFNHEPLESTDFSNESPDSQGSNSVSPTTFDHEDSSAHEKRKQNSGNHKNADAAYNGESDFSLDKTDYSRLKKQKGEAINTETGEPAAKRKAQNRRAQRAFRERKEKHLKDLEIKVCQLESAADVTNTENESLKQQVERLQKELRTFKNASSSIIPPSTQDGNNIISTKPNPQPDHSAPKPSLPERSFNFEFPFYSQTSPAANPHHRITHNSDKSPSIQSQVSPSSSSVSAGSHVSNASSTGRSSSNSDSPALSSITSRSDTPAAVNTETSGRAKSESHVSGLSSFCEELGKACVQPCNLWDEPFESEPKKEKLDVDDQSVPNSMFNFNYVDDYREPLFNIGDDFTLPAMTTTENSLFDPLENIFGVGLELPGTFSTESSANDSSSKPKKHSNYEQVPSNTQDYLPCQAVWHRISSHPRFGDLDIDGLCSELRTKAKCSENGLLMNSKDLDKVLNKLG